MVVGGGGNCACSFGAAKNKAPRITAQAIVPALIIVIFLSSSGHFEFFLLCQHPGHLPRCRQFVQAMCLKILSGTWTHPSWKHFEVPFLPGAGVRLEIKDLLIN